MKWNLHPSFRKKGLARLFIDQPAFLEAVAVNFLAPNLFTDGALFAAWLIPGLKKKG